MRTCVSEQRRDRLAGDNPDTPVCFTDKDIAGPGGYVTKLDIWLRPWQGDVVIAGEYFKGLPLVQWSLQFKTPPFNCFLHFKTDHPATQLLFCQYKYSSISKAPSAST